jgi:asparagine synthase (glutamine-hydrolysing)
LSGGVDSSSVVASLGRATDGSFSTYFGGFSPQLNRYLPNPEEPAMSKLVAERVGANHHMLWLEPETLESIREIISVLEEPVCDGGCIVLSAVMRKAKSDVDGLMTGIGGDFLFTGERRHMVLNLLRFMRPIPDAAWRALNYILGLPIMARSARISQAHFDLTRVLAIRRLGIEAMYAGFFLQAEPSEMCLLFLPDVYAKLQRDPLKEMNDDFRVAADLDPLSQFLYLDLKHQTPEHCLREAETLGRHYGLKVYSPFLDADFVDFAMSVPSADKVSGLNLKVPLKKAMRGRVPDEVLDRKKGGLGSPIRWWVTQPDGLVASVLSRQNIERRGLFSPEAVEQFTKATANGTHDYTKLLWSLFTLEIWLQQFVDKSRGARLQANGLNSGKRQQR